jgi:hypothetical protein
MTDYKRKYLFKYINPSNEKKNFWIFILVGLALGAAIIYFF